MNKLFLYVFVVLIAATTLFIFTPINSNAKVRMVVVISDKSISGYCYDDVNHSGLAGLEVRITGPHGPFNGTTDETGHFEIGESSLHNEANYHILAKSPGFNQNGGYKGEADITTPDCTVNGCGFEVVQDVECHYYDNPN